MQEIPQDWNRTIQARHGHVLQSKEWANFQESIGRPALFELKSDWYWLGFERVSKGIRYLLAPYSPTVERDAEAALASIVERGKRLGCDFVRVEPIGEVTAEDLKNLGAKKIADVQPSHTLVLDLTQDESTLRQGLQSGHRNRINTADKRGVKVSSSTSLNVLPEFLRLLHDTATRAKIVNHPDSYYQKMAKSMIEQDVAKFYTATAEGQSASISLIFDWGDTRYYAHTGNDQALNRSHKAAVSNVWQMIIDAKAEGKKHFDFWGIAPSDDKDHPWAGITEFKKGFGGEIVSNLGTWDIPIKKHKYQLYTAYRKLKGLE